MKDYYGTTDLHAQESFDRFHRIVAKTAARIVSGRDMYRADEPFQSTGTITSPSSFSSWYMLPWSALQIRLKVNLARSRSLLPRSKSHTLLSSSYSSHMSSMLGSHLMLCSSMGTPLSSHSLSLALSSLSSISLLLESSTNQWKVGVGRPPIAVHDAWISPRLFGSYSSTWLLSSHMSGSLM